MPGGGGSGTARLTVRSARGRVTAHPCETGLELAVRSARGRVTAHPCETGLELAEWFCPWARDGASLP